MLCKRIIDIFGSQFAALASTKPQIYSHSSDKYEFANWNPPISRWHRVMNLDVGNGAGKEMKEAVTETEFVIPEVGMSVAEADPVVHLEEVNVTDDQVRVGIIRNISSM